MMYTLHPLVGGGGTTINILAILAQQQQQQQKGGGSLSGTCLNWEIWQFYANITLVKEKL